MENSIRKISIGSDVNNQLHISVNNPIGGNIVSHILKGENNNIEVWIEGKNSGVLKWKTLENMPVIIEYDTKSI